MKQGRREGRGTEEKKEREKQERKMGHGGKGGGVAVWRFQFLPFAWKLPQFLTLTIFDFRLAKKGKGLHPSRFGYFVRIRPQSRNIGQSNPFSHTVSR